MLERLCDRSNLRGVERVVDCGECDFWFIEWVLDRLDRDWGDNYISDCYRDRLIEIFGRERFLDRNLDRVIDCVFE